MDLDPSRVEMENKHCLKEDNSESGTNRIRIDAFNSKLVESVVSWVVTFNGTFGDCVT